MDVFHYDHKSFTTASILTTYHVYQKFKGPLKVYRVISKSHKIESHLNFIRFSIIKSFSIIILELIISIPSYYVPTSLLLNPISVKGWWKMAIFHLKHSYLNWRVNPCKRKRLQFFIFFWIWLSWFSFGLNRIIQVHDMTINFPFFFSFIFFE